MRALETFVAGQRLDMQRLAAEVGISRATLYRRVMDRDRLLGAVLWYLTRINLLRALEAAGDATGAERVVLATKAFTERVHEQPSFHRFLEHEPEAALRILTSKYGPVQGQLVGVTERLLAIEEERGALRLGIDRATLSYVIVRVGESFLYADVIADNVPDLDAHAQVIAQLLREDDPAPQPEDPSLSGT
jgi:AcrR family transcriptional regulator